MANKSSYIGTENKGNPVLLRKDSIPSAVSSITFDGVFDDRFDEYWVTLFNMTVSTASGVQIYYKYRSGGSDVTGTHYRNQRAISMNSDNTQQYGNATTTNYNVITDYSFGTSATREALNSVMYLFPRRTNVKYAFHDAISIADSSNHYAHEFISVLDDATQVDGFTLYASSGNLAGGEICVYGIKK